MELKEISQREVGFKWQFAVEKELHIESGTRTPDKVTLHASLEGHADTYGEAVEQLESAKKEIDTVLQQKETEAKKDEQTQA